MSESHKPSVDDLLPGLETPIWIGEDVVFTDDMQEAFGLPRALTTIRITPIGSAGRSAVAIEGAEGALLLVLTPNSSQRQTHIRPILMGPIFNNADILRRARSFDVNATAKAVTSLLLRHVPVETVRALMMADFH